MDPAIQGGLFVVATPIGNLEDITLRAVRILKEADCIAAEDTRHSRKLLSHFSIATPVTSYHEHNERAKAEALVARMQQGERIALVTDAGTPCVSDPGYRLIRLCHEHGVPVVAVPGPCAAVAALSISGLPSDTFTFHGFFPRKASEADALIDRLGEQCGTHVFYEAPNRMTATLARLAGRWPEADAAVARELTKLHEELRTGRLADLAPHYDETRGECVIVLTVPEEAPAAAPSDADLRAEVEAMMTAEDISRRDAVRRVAEKRGLPRKAVYAAAVLESDP